MISFGTPTTRTATTEETDMKTTFRLAERSSDSRVRPRWNPANREAEALARCTGSREVTVRHERRNADGTLTVLSEGSYTRPDLAVPHRHPSLPNTPQVPGSRADRCHTEEREANGFPVLYCTTHGQDHMHCPSVCGDHERPLPCLECS